MCHYELAYTINNSENLKQIQIPATPCLEIVKEIEIESISYILVCIVIGKKKHVVC